MADAEHDWGAWADGQLTEIRAAGRRRATRNFDACGPRGDLDGQQVVSYASNDYLGLATHPEVIEAAHAAIDRWGTGSTASRLIVGSRPCHEELEREIADWKRCDRAVLFPTGFAANLGVLSVVGGPDVTVFSDELNHASIIDGCRLGRSRVQVYRHTDVDHLDSLLASSAGRRVVVTDSVFSMDGDLAPLDAMATVCARQGALLVLDEAHAVLGPDAPLGVDGLEVIRVGTLSKTLGSLGGWVAGSASMIDLLINRARPFIFTTAPTPADVAAGSAALRIVRSNQGDELVGRLRRSVDRIRDGHPSPIIPIVLGDEDRAMKSAAALLERGIFIPAIRPPTVPAGTARLRVALSASHTDQMIDHLLDALDDQNLR